MSETGGQRKPKSAASKARYLERKLRFQKQAKTNNVFRARKTNNQQYQQQAKNDQLRKRGFYTILSTEEFEEVPQCSHGPCLFFSKKTEVGPEEKYFACAVYRGDEKLCDFRMNVNENNEIVKPEEKEEEEEGDEPPKKKKKVEKKKKELWGYGKIPTKVKKLTPEDVLLYCEQCIDVFPNKHACVCEPIEPSRLLYPTKLLPPLEEQHGEAQYFFSEEALGVILSTIENAQVDGVLCIAAPRVFESLKNSKSVKNLFMLDYDKRFAKFYPSKQYGQYSMLVDHFFDQNTEPKLIEFFEKCSKVLVVVDPPFGVFIEPMMKSIDKMTKRFDSVRVVNSEEKSFYSMIILPLFVGKHVLRKDEAFWMSDYRVTYDNHKIYANPQKTIVRIFTDLAKSSIDLSDHDGYRFCEECDRHVRADNLHCAECHTCPSIDYGTYVHCNRCEKCVKPNYIHCYRCKWCHLKGRCILPEYNEDPYPDVSNSNYCPLGNSKLA